VLTKAKVAEHDEAKGGILADDMGLGKSLTILAAIASSLKDAASFASNWKGEALLHDQVPSRATLIIVPSTSTCVPKQTLTHQSMNG
jgi:SWI/SNF-related matrix-associated actin-dependent regulator of chromatin subfamily A3